MKVAGVIVGIAVLLMGSGSVPVAYAQQAAPPSMNFTLTDALNRPPTEAPKADDFREVKPPPMDKLSDAVRVTVTVGDPRCLPGEEGLFTPRAFRPGRSR